ncbi:transcriptional regulator [Marivirga lumbricoides]|uniref:Transcriptional regulator n=3 Tax=Marivirga lumbricoides TaxID=1046115 RepID=A0ABQ1MYG4_9BACT|nr:transcriptional regulator [Marivirga lumbricoides]
MNYTLHQLQVFLKVTETLSITKAAQELYLTQPAVSIQLKNFQDQFDIPLTEVVGRKVFVTDFGKEIAIAAEKILAEVNAINYKTLAYKGQLIGKLKISAVSTGKYVMPFFLSDFMKSHEGIELSLDVTNKSSVIQSLEKNEVDFSLVSILPENLSIDSITLMENKLYLVNSKPLNKKQKYFDKSILSEVPLIYREQGSGTRQTMEMFLKANNLPVKKKMELTSNEAVKQAVIAGLGYSVLPLIGIKNEVINGDLHVIPVKEFPIKSTWRLIWLKNKKFSPAASAFLHYLEKEKEDIIKQTFGWYELY